MADVKIFSVQPRFTAGNITGGWSYVESIFRMGQDAPAEGSLERDIYLGQVWKDEPMTAGVFNKWTEKVQSVNWRVSGGRNQARYFANMFQQANAGRGWSDYQAGAIDFLTTDKGEFTELGRSEAAYTQQVLDVLRHMRPEGVRPITDPDKLRVDDKFAKTLEQASEGRVMGIQHVDATRLVRLGYAGALWRYYPEWGNPVTFPDANLIQITSLSSARDRFFGYGACALSRVLDAKKLMSGYLRFYMQEIGALPPELVVIINGLPATDVQESFQRYKQEAEAAGLDTYKGRWWLGSDDPSQPVSVTTHSLLPQQKSFDYPTMVEWWMKVLSLNTGEAVGDYWLMQHPGNTNTLQSIQSMKASGTGTGRYLQEKERQINLRILPYGVNFEFDNKDDDADARRVDILATNIDNLKKLAEIVAPVEKEKKTQQKFKQGANNEGDLASNEQNPEAIFAKYDEANPGAAPEAAPAQPPMPPPEPAQPGLFSADALRQLAVDWEILSPELADVSSDSLPITIMSTMKQLAYPDEEYIIDSNLVEKKMPKVLTSSSEIEAAKYVYQTMKEAYGV